MAACVADVGLLEKALLPPLLRLPRVSQALAAAPVLMLDGNLAEAALEVRTGGVGVGRLGNALCAGCHCQKHAAGRAHCKMLHICHRHACRT